MHIIKRTRAIDFQIATYIFAWHRPSRTKFNGWKRHVYCQHCFHAWLSHGIFGRGERSRYLAETESTGVVNILGIADVIITRTSRTINFRSIVCFLLVHFAARTLRLKHLLVRLGLWFSKQKTQKMFDAWCTYSQSKIITHCRFKIKSGGDERVVSTGPPQANSALTKRNPLISGGSRGRRTIIRGKSPRPCI